MDYSGFYPVCRTSLTWHLDVDPSFLVWCDFNASLVEKLKDLKALKLL